MYKYLNVLIFAIFISLNSNAYTSESQIPNLVGTWVGINNTLSEQRGYRSGDKKVEIIEQKDRRFKGTFSYTDGQKTSSV